MKHPPIWVGLTLASLGWLAGQPLSLANQVATASPATAGGYPTVRPSATETQPEIGRALANASELATHTNETSSGEDSSRARKCSRQSVQLARQMLAHEFDRINEYLSSWLNDLDKDELMEEQKESLSSAIMSGLSGKLLNADGQPLFEVESSYLRALDGQRMSLKLMRRNTDRCYLDKDNYKYSYVTRVSLGPLEHNLDVVYNFPKEFRLSQPTSWKYAQVRLRIPKMVYEVTVRQIADYKLDGSVSELASERSRLEGVEQSACPLEVLDVTYLAGAGGPAKSAQISVLGSGLPANNQTVLQLERLFNDYTRPTVSGRLRQLLKFYLSSKTLPLFG